jgi:hypothetical protein
MGLHAHRTLESNPFLQHALHGWQPAIPHIRYPVTFGLYREGENWGLFLAPTDLACVRRGLDLDDDEMALVMTGAQILDDAFLQAPHPSKLIPWCEIDNLTGEIDLVHVPRAAIELVTGFDLCTPILAAPERAVPTDIGSQVAIGLNDGCHVAIISPSLSRLQGCLRHFIQDYIVSVMQRDTDLPELPDRLVRSLLVPMEAGAWSELMLRVHKRFWTLELRGPSGEATPTRWVCEGESGRWRDGWSW